MQSHAQSELRVVDRKPSTDAFMSAVLTGLSKDLKTVPSKFLYDERGSQLFDAICKVDEYYPTRTELAILREHGPAIARRVGEGACVVELGSGSSNKTRLFLDALREPAAYVPVEISKDALVDAVHTLEHDYPTLAIVPVCADYTKPFPVPRVAHESGSLCFYFPGSTIGNLPRREAVAFLRHLRALAGRRSNLVIGADLRKPVDVLERAYDDAAGVTAEFNLNLLARMNRELGADFDLDAFEHRAVWNERESRIEMHLVSKRPQRVSVGGQAFRFDEKEPIVTEYSHKYDTGDLRALYREGGFELEAHWTDKNNMFSMGYCISLE